MNHPIFPLSSRCHSDSSCISSMSSRAEPRQSPPFSNDSPAASPRGTARYIVQTMIGRPQCRTEPSRADWSREGRRRRAANVSPGDRRSNELLGDGRRPGSPRRLSTAAAARPVQLRAAQSVVNEEAALKGEEDP